MAKYVRKTKDAPRVSGAWLKRKSAALLADGFTARELRVVKWHDVDGLTWRAVGKKLKRAHERGRQIYHRVLRKMKHPRRRALAAGMFQG